VHILSSKQKGDGTLLYRSFSEDLTSAIWVEHTEIFESYIEAVMWAQEFAKYNHQIMMYNALHTWFNYFKYPKPSVREYYVHCQHNYVAREITLDKM